MFNLRLTVFWKEEGDGESSVDNDDTGSSSDPDCGTSISSSSSSTLTESLLVLALRDGGSDGIELIEDSIEVGGRRSRGLRYRSSDDMIEIKSHVTAQP